MFSELKVCVREPSTSGENGDSYIDSDTSEKKYWSVEY